MSKHMKNKSLETKINNFNGYQLNVGIIQHYNVQ